METLYSTGQTGTQNLLKIGTSATPQLPGGAALPATITHLELPGMQTTSSSAIIISLDSSGHMWQSTGTHKSVSLIDSSISALQTYINSNTSSVTNITNSIGAASGICPLNTSTLISPQYLPNATPVAIGAIFGSTTTSNAITSLGYSASSNNTTGTNNTYIGYGANSSSTATNISHVIAIGSGATATASNQFIIDPTVTTITFPGITHSTTDNGSNTIVAVDSSGNLWKTGGTYNTVSAIDTVITTIQSNITTLQTDESTNASNITTLQSDVSTLQSDETTNATNISTNTTDITNIKTSVGAASGICPLNASTLIATTYLPNATSTTTGVIFGLTDSATTTAITSVGYSAGSNNTTGTNNTYIGYNANSNSTDDTISHVIALGSGATATVSDQFIIDPTVTTITFPGLTHSSTDNGSNNIIAVDSSGNLWKTGGTYNTVSAIDTVITTIQSDITTLQTDETTNASNVTTNTTNITNIKTSVGAASGICPLNASTLVATSYLPLATPTTTGVIYGLTDSATTTAITSVGYSAGSNNTTGTNNTYIGYGANSNSTDETISHVIALGSGATAIVSDQFIIDPTVTTITFPGITHSTTDNGSNNIVVVDSSGNLWKTGGTYNTVSAIDTVIGTLQSDITTLQTDESTNASNITTLQSDVSTLQSDETTNTTNISTNTTNISNIKTSIGAASGICPLDSSTLVATTYLPAATTTTLGIVMGLTQSGSPYNTFLGANISSTGTSNTAMGYYSLNSNTTGTNNTSIGSTALQYNTTGYSNTAIGWGALYENTTGINNIAVGGSALAANTDTYNSTAIGSAALYVSTGGGNTAVGSNAGVNTTTGTNNTFIGYNATPSTTDATISNSIAIGYGATPTLSNQFIIDPSVTTVTFPGLATAAAPVGYMSIDSSGNLKPWIPYAFGAAISGNEAFIVDTSTTYSPRYSVVFGNSANFNTLLVGTVGGLYEWHVPTGGAGLYLLSSIATMENNTDLDWFELIFNYYSSTSSSVTSSTLFNYTEDVTYGQWSSINATIIQPMIVGDYIYWQVNAKSSALTTAQIRNLTSYYVTQMAPAYH